MGRNPNMNQPIGTENEEKTKVINIKWATDGEIPAAEKNYGIERSRHLMDISIASEILILRKEYYNKCELPHPVKGCGFD
jgi:hypothetical protein